MPAFQMHPTRWVAILAGILLFFLVISGKVRYTFGDSRYALLASQAILEHGSPRLDTYANELPLVDNVNGPQWVLFQNESNGHIYYDYPVGTTVLSLPFVAVARAWGFELTSYWYDDQLQILIAATLLVIVFLLLFKLSRLYLEDWPALLFSLLFVLGTSLTSVLATALWSSNFETVFIILVLLEFASVAKGRRSSVRGALVGCFLFAAYLSRPSAMVFLLLTFIYLGWRHRKALLPAIAVSGGLFLLFVLWSYLEMQVLLPRYYRMDNWKPYGEFFQNLWPILVGPARGLFSFTPVLLLGLAGFAMARLRREPLYLLMWGWFLLETWMVLRSKVPWGGWCYGPRLFVELLPGMALALLMTLEGCGNWRPSWQRVLGALFLAFSCFGVYVHTWQGLFITHSQDWNDHPNIDQAWANVRWDWRFPQFMASPHQLNLRRTENEMAGEVSQLLDQIPAGAALLFGKPEPIKRAIFDHWNGHDALHKGKPVFNSVMAIHGAGFKEFWFKSDLLKDLRQDHRVRIDPPISDSLMGPDSIMVAAPLPPLGHAFILIPPP